MTDDLIAFVSELAADEVRDLSNASIRLQASALSNDAATGFWSRQVERCGERAAMLVSVENALRAART